MTVVSAAPPATSKDSITTEVTGQTPTVVKPTANAAVTDEEAATVSNNKDTTQLSSQEKRQNKKEKKFRERSEIARNGIDEANQYISEVHANTPPPQKKNEKKSS